MRKGAIAVIGFVLVLPLLLIVLPSMLRFVHATRGGNQHPGAGPTGTETTA